MDYPVALTLRSGTRLGAVGSVGLQPSWPLCYTCCCLFKFTVK